MLTNRYLGGHGFGSRRGPRFGLCPTPVANEHVIFIIYSPGIKFTIFIQFVTQCLYSFKCSFSQITFAIALLEYKMAVSRILPWQPRLNGTKTMDLGWRDFTVHAAVGSWGLGPHAIKTIINGCRLTWEGQWRCQVLILRDDRMLTSGWRRIISSMVRMEHILLMSENGGTTSRWIELDFFLCVCVCAVLIS